MPTESKMDLLFENLSCSGTKPAILSLIPKFADSYMPKSSHAGFPKPLKSLKQASYLDLDYHELLKVCESVSVEVTEEMAKLVEKATRSQSQSKLWFKYRAERIIASRMKAVCHTDAGNPAQSLITTVCFQMPSLLPLRQQDGVASMKEWPKKFTTTPARVSTIIYT